MARRPRCLFALPLALLCLCAAPSGHATARAAARDATLVRTHTGPITGQVTEGVREYLGIPYAASPVGKRRWAPPVDPAAWTTPRPCTRFAPACPQGKTSAFKQVRHIAEADSLALNVWTAATSPRDRRPVMVWIHGGGFVQGTGASPIYDGTKLAKRGVVVVTINYRLGAIGFLCHPGLSAESETHTSGNYGLMDQIHALKWVRKNIAAFGGDKGNVTIFGESAGGVSVALHLASPLSRGLFHRAIMESGAVPRGMRHRTEKRGALVSAESAGKDLARKLLGPKADSMSDAEQVRAMRALPWGKVMQASYQPILMPGKTMNQWVCVDGYVLTDDPAVTLAAGRGAKVPTMAGSNADEGTLFAKRAARGMTLAKYRALAAAAFGDHAPQALTMYPAATDADVPAALSKVLGDIFVQGARSVVRYQSDAGQRAWLYHFTAERPWARRIGLGVFHAAEIPYVFGVLKPLMYGKADRELSERMMDYWVRFARTGDPNTPGRAAWPAYTTKTDRHLELGTTTTNAAIRPGQHLRKKACDFLDKMQRDR